MPITFVADGTPTQGHEGRLMRPDLPAGLQQGDLMVVVAYAGRPDPDHQSTAQIPWGLESPNWIEAESFAPGYGGFLGVWYRFYQGTNDDPVLVPLNDAVSQFAVAQVAAWRLINTVDPIALDSQPLPFAWEGFGSILPFSEFVAPADALVLMIGGKVFADVTGGATPPGGLGFTEIYTEGGGIVAYQVQPGPIMAWFYAITTAETEFIDLAIAITENDLGDPPYPGIGTVLSFNQAEFANNVRAAALNYRARGG